MTHVIPVVKTLQKKFPDCPITWVIGRLEHRLLSGLPGVEFIVFDKKQGWRGIQSLRRELKGRRFDVLLHMQLSFRANVVARFIPAKRRIGFDRHRSKEFHSWAVNERIAAAPDGHVLDGFMQFAKHLGCVEKVMNWDLPMNQADQQFAHQLIKPGVSNVVISPCSSHPLRNWTVTKYAAMIEQIIKRHGAHVILTGSPAPQEQAFVAEIERSVKQPITNVAGQDTLKQLWCLLQQADLVISPDSGPLHMAGCVGTPVIGLLAASNFRRSGSYQFPELTVDKYPEACERFLGQSVMQVKWGTKTEFPGAMDLIEVEHVLPVVEQVLQ